MTIFNMEHGFEGVQTFLNEIHGGNLDEMIDFRSKKYVTSDIFKRNIWGAIAMKWPIFKSRDLWYFKRNLSELVMYGYKSLRRGELNENDNFD